MDMNIERVSEATPELHELIDELGRQIWAASAPWSVDRPFVRAACAVLYRAPGWRRGRLRRVALFDDLAEVKRMYTRPAMRGRGLAKALLSRIEDEVQAAGKRLICLETGPYQHEAIGLYQRIGFTNRESLGQGTERRCRPV